MYASADGELDKQLRSNMFSLSGTGFFGAVGRSINLGKHQVQICLACIYAKEINLLFILMSGGQTALALRLLLAAFSSKVSSDVNRPFGDEVISKCAADRY